MKFRLMLLVLISTALGCAGGRPPETILMPKDIEQKAKQMVPNEHDALVYIMRPAGAAGGVGIAIDLSNTIGIEGPGLTNAISGLLETNTFIVARVSAGTMKIFAQSARGFAQKLTYQDDSGKFFIWDKYAGPNSFLSKKDEVIKNNNELTIWNEKAHALLFNAKDGIGKITGKDTTIITSFGETTETALRSFREFNPGLRLTNMEIVPINSKVPISKRIAETKKGESFHLSPGQTYYFSAKIALVGLSSFKIEIAKMSREEGMNFITNASLSDAIFAYTESRQLRPIGTFDFADDFVVNCAHLKYSAGVLHCSREIDLVPIRVRRKTVQQGRYD